MTTINDSQKTVTRSGMTWPLGACGLSDLVAEYGADIVASVITSRDYYPPMIDPTEKLEIEESCQAKMIARAYISIPGLRPQLERMSYTAGN